MVLTRVFALLAAVVTLTYARGPLYHFPPPTRFAGSAFLNPYAAAPGAWQRANLHAHGRPWNGVTNGRQSAKEIVEAYRARGYAIAGVSDYQHIAADDGVETIRIYEHGYNIGKRHQLAIGARSVEWFDFPLWQSTGDKQFVIDRVGAKADLVALAHPWPDAYSIEDLQQLTGYELLEVVNGPFVLEEGWDAALSTGHLVWAIADDDTHDLNDPRRTGIAWNMIGAATPATDDVVDALRAGRTFAVVQTDEDRAPVDTVVPRVDFRNGILTVAVDEPSTFLFIGQGGAVRKSVKQTTKATYAFAPADTYIRTVIRSASSATFINPIVRYDGTRVPVPVATENFAGTWLKRAVFFAATGVLVVLGFRKRESQATAHRT